MHARIASQPFSRLTNPLGAWMIWLGIAGCLISVLVRADSWLPPTTEVYVSTQSGWRFTVVPRPLSSPLEYFKDKVANRDNAGGVSGSAQTSALGTMEHQVQRHWRVVWKKPLLNEVAPVGVLVSEHGQAITLDDWHGMGYGKNAVVFYDANGKVVRALSLADFLPEEYIDALPHSVSSIQWRGKPAISNDGSQLDL